MTLRRLYRCIYVQLVNNKTIYLNEDQTNKLFESYSLPSPTMIPPVLSLQFRESINKYGLTIVDIDKEHMGRIRYIPPTQIKSVDFYITTEEFSDKDIELLQE